MSALLMIVGECNQRTGTIAHMFESAGWDDLYMADAQNLAPDVHMSLALAAASTHRMMPATGVTNPATHHPAVTASAIAAVQAASGGRAVLGIGRGDSSLGDLGRKPAKVPDFEVYVSQVRGFLHGDEVDLGRLHDPPRRRSSPRTPMTESETPMADNLLLDSLRRRMAAMHTLWYDAVDTMGPEHVNHFERDGVLPIAFSLFHYANMQDVTFAVLTGEAPIWNEDWQSRVQMAVDDHGKERTVDEMLDQRVGDYEAFKDYMRTVYQRTEAWLDGLERNELDRVVVPRPFPPVVADTFSARVAGEDGVTVLDAIECWWYQHGMRHMGEIELARGLVGLGGMTS